MVDHTRGRARRNRRGLTLLVAVAMIAAAFGLSGTSSADVTEVIGSASGATGSVGLFGGPPNNFGPTPTVTLPPGGGGPVTETVPTLTMSFGPALFFKSGEVTVSTQGTTGPTGSVTSSTSFAPTAGTANNPCPFAYPATFTAGSTTVTSATANFTAADVGRTVSSEFLPETPPPTEPERIATIVSVESPTSVTLSVAPEGSGTGYLSINRGPGTCVYNSAFTADTASSTCTANESGVTGSTTFTNGLLTTASDDYQNPTVVVAIPDNPAPNTAIDGFFILNGGTTESFTYTFNEQIINPDGSLTVHAVHLEAKGQTAVGHTYFGTVTCGVESVVVTTTTSPTTTSTTTSTTSTTTSTIPTTTSTLPTTSTTTSTIPTSSTTTSSTVPTSTTTTLPTTSTTSTSTTSTIPTSTTTSTTIVPPDTECGGVTATIVGTPGPDRLTGTDGPDVIHGLGGDDHIFALEGDDLVCGGGGNDIIQLSAGHDTASGGDGDDRIVGASGRDLLRGSAGNDVLRGGSGNDHLNGGPGDDDCLGGSGINTYSNCQTQSLTAESTSPTSAFSPAPTLRPAQL